MKVASEFMSGDERRTLLKPGDVGIVETLDADGDATVHFPSLEHVKNKHRWVLKNCFGELVRCNPHGVASSKKPPSEENSSQLVKPCIVMRKIAKNTTSSENANM